VVPVGREGDGEGQEMGGGEGGVRAESGGPEAEELWVYRKEKWGGGGSEVGYGGWRVSVWGGVGGRKGKRWRGGGGHQGGGGRWGGGVREGKG